LAKLKRTLEGACGGALRMAFMDVASKGAPNERTVLV
jgi:hypothetical protein